ncbi:hypothetical protein K466DRAFT_288532 [Polyporus arcularius HHB13444]|uniref:Uncharacterized protein n=1 Tax=Polyporus arcularius HHB13444 TaxID=1314778 RepID=A0A5C3P184_9APHY|nr:hypothetical protein K466DRAFT_288532 [Polyporus arcularius HHB13444]
MIKGTAPFHDRGRLPDQASMPATYQTRGQDNCRAAATIASRFRGNRTRRRATRRAGSTGPAGQDAAWPMARGEPAGLAHEKPHFDQFLR